MILLGTQNLFFKFVFCVFQALSITVSKITYFNEFLNPWLVVGFFISYSQKFQVFPDCYSSAILVFLPLFLSGFHIVISYISGPSALYTIRLFSGFWELLYEVHWILLSALHFFYSQLYSPRLFWNQTC